MESRQNTFFWLRKNVEEADLIEYFSGFSGVNQIEPFHANAHSSKSITANVVGSIATDSQGR
jgi:hypothetical protein